MSNTSRDSTERERDRQTRRVEAITGTYFCHAGAHHARGSYDVRKGRKVCAACAAKIRGAMK